MLGPTRAQHSFHFQALYPSLLSSPGPAFMSTDSASTPVVMLKEPFGGSGPATPTSHLLINGWSMVERLAKVVVRGATLWCRHRVGGSTQLSVVMKFSVVDSQTVLSQCNRRLLIMSHHASSHSMGILKQRSILISIKTLSTKACFYFLPKNNKTLGHHCKGTLTSGGSYSSWFITPRCIVSLLNVCSKADLKLNVQK